MEALTPADVVVATAALGGALVTGALGYGFSSITVPVALLYIPSRVLAPSLVLVELFTNLFGLFMHRRTVPLVARRMTPMLAGLLPGVALGAWVLSSANSGPLKLGTYAVLLPLVIAQTSGRRWPIRREKTAAIPTGAAIGALYSATTISGPPLALFLNNQGLAPEQFRAAVYLMRVAESLVTTLVYVGLGLFTAPTLSLAGTLVPSLLVGLPIGMLLLSRLEPEAFRRLCMGVNAAFIAFGLARSMIEMRVAPPPVAYGAMIGLGLVAWVLVARYFVRRPRAVRERVGAPQA
jgi:uncharacterized membrane protein YfcA